MEPVLNTHLPDDMATGYRLPGTRPVEGSWLHFDEAYGGQLAVRRDLIATKRCEVYWCSDAAQGPARELLNEVLTLLPDLGFKRREDAVHCPDGTVVQTYGEDPLVVLGQLVQSDFCLLEKVGHEHVLQGAILCFPAGWRLAEKAGRPLSRIHDPVEEYDDALARRVQRLFDGVKVGRPVWRFNRLWYDDPSLFQPRSALTPRPVQRPQSEAPYYRTERQVVLRLPQSNWCVFAIHTKVLRASDVPTLEI